MAMASDTTRHAGVGLQNRRVQVRFLSHLHGTKFPGHPLQLSYTKSGSMVFLEAMGELYANDIYLV